MGNMLALQVEDPSSIRQKQNKASEPTKMECGTCLQLLRHGDGGGERPVRDSISTNGGWSIRNET